MTHTNSTHANPIPPGWPDPLESPQAEAIRNGKLDDTEIRNLFDCMERELRLHRERAANPAQGVSDEAVFIAGNILMQHGLNAPERVIYQAARAALTAAIGAGGAGGGLPEKPTQAMRIAYDELNNSLGLDRFVNFDLVWEKIRSHLPPHPAPSGQAVAWMRKWAFDGIDVMAMPKKERPAGWMLHEVTRHQCLPDDVPLYAHPVQQGWREPDGFTPYLWQCKDYADGWISYADKEEALAYQRDTGCLLRITYRPVAPQPKGE